MHRHKKQVHIQHVTQGPMDSLASLCVHSVIYIYVYTSVTPLAHWRHTRVIHQRLGGIAGIYRRWIAFVIYSEEKSKTHRLLDCTHAPSRLQQEHIAAFGCCFHFGLGKSVEIFTYIQKSLKQIPQSPCFSQCLGTCLSRFARSLRSISGLCARLHLRRLRRAFLTRMPLSSNCISRRVSFSSSSEYF